VGRKALGISGRPLDDRNSGLRRGLLSAFSWPDQMRGNHRKNREMAITSLAIMDLFKTEQSLQLISRLSQELSK